MAKPASKKQTPFSVWYTRTTTRRRKSPPCLKEADAFQRLVSVLQLRKPDGICAPQRSRRLSASGIGRTWTRSFPCLWPQRSRRLSASGMMAMRQVFREGDGASKKQTPFSVWYSKASHAARPTTTWPQRSRRLSASGMSGLNIPPQLRLSASKKQTPFSVWYHIYLLLAARRR